jgi:outer membrane protein TolC
VDQLPAGILTLATARGIAVGANPDVHAARARLEAARARIAEALAPFMPTVALKHTSTWTFQTPPSRPRLETAIQSVQELPILGTDPLEGVAPILRPLFEPLFRVGQLQPNTSVFSDHSTALAATWTLFDGFVREADALAAKYLHAAAGHSLGDVERLIIHAVDTAYYQIQLAEERIRIARADEAFSREQFEETQKLLRAKRASRADADNFRVRMLAAQANVTAAIGLRDSGRVALAELMGRPQVVLGDDIALSPLAKETEDEMSLPEAQQWVERALADRPDLLQLRAILRGKEENVHAARGLFSPILSVSGSWGFERSSSLRYSAKDQSSAGALDLRWELYTGGARRARLRAAQSARTEAAAALYRLRLSVQAQVRNAVIDLADAQEQIRLQRENLHTARRNRDDIEKAWLAGKETLTRLNEAQRDFIEADAGLALSRIRLRQAWSDLNAAAATYRETRATEQAQTP